MANEVYVRKEELDPQNHDLELFPNFFVAQHAERFLDCIERIAPDVVSDLLALRQEFCTALAKAESIKNLYHLVINPFSSSEGETGTFKTNLYNWAKRHNLIDHEMNNRQYVRVGFLFLRDYIDHGECSLSDGVDYPNESEFNFNFLFPIHFCPKPEMMVFKTLHRNGKMKRAAYNKKICDLANFETVFNKTISSPSALGCSWDPRKMPKEDFKSIATELFSDYLELLLDRTEKLMRDHGFLLATGERHNNHAEWLVRYQILNESYNEIAEFCIKNDDSGKLKDKPLSPSTIRKGVIKEAQLLNLSLRGHSKKGK